MSTPIDFGKDFLWAYYRERDLEKTLGFLAEDIVWVTPDEMLHLKTPKEIRDFLAASIGEDPQPYHVDIASIKSAAVSGNTNTIAYEVNLIPRREQDTVNLRAALTVHKTGKKYELVYIGMSRRYDRSESEQLKDFLENMPSGVMVLAGFGGNAFRELYANSYFPIRLGYDPDEFYDRSDNNPFFMIPDREQRRMITLVNEMSTLKRPKPISAQINLVNAQGESLPFQVTTRAAYKDRDGSRTVLYLLFSDLSEILLEQERRQKRLAARAAAEQAEQQNETGQEEQKDGNGNEPQTVDEIRREEEKARRLRREAEEMQARAEEQLDSIDRLMNAAKEACEHAEEDARNRADAEIARAGKEQERKLAQVKEDAEAAQQALQKSAEEEQQKIRTEAEASVKAAEEKLSQLQTQKEKSDQDYEDRIHALEQELEKTRADTKAQMNQLLDRNKAVLDQLKAENEQQLEEARQAAQQAQEKEQEQHKAELESLQAEAEGSRQGFLQQIRRYQDRLAQNTEGQKRQDEESAVRLKEQEKSMQRLSSLLEGQMNSIRSLTMSAEKEEDAAKRAGIGEKITAAAEEVPQMAEDLYAIARLDPADRSLQEQTFTLSSCLNTVIRVIRPQCRRKGVVFSCDTDGQVPDQVRGSKAGLQLAFLCILENAVSNTAQGGKIRLTAQADRPVRNRAYFHFRISDTGTGIPDDKLPMLFDNPTSELSIARKIIAGMGGSIQVRSSYGSGSRFEISVNLKLVG